MNKKDLKKLLSIEREEDTVLQIFDEEEAEIARVLDESYEYYLSASYCLIDVVHYLASKDTYRAMQCRWTAAQKMRTYNSMMLDILKHPEIHSDVMDNDYQMWESYTTNAAAIDKLLADWVMVTKERIIIK